MIHRLVTLSVLLVTCITLPLAATAGGPDAARIQQIAAAVSDGTYGATPTIENREFWQKVGRLKDYQTIVGMAEKNVSQRFQTLPDDLYLEYSRNGNRSRYQDVYSAKLKLVRTFVMAECIENKGRFIKPIQQAVSSYAADKTWVLPAHDSGQENFLGRQITIDLFSSEVACELANADHILGDRLDQETRALIRKEARRRIFDPYTSMVTKGKPRMWWLTGTNNWNAVCLANISSTALALLEKPSEKAFYIASAEKHITSFFEGFTNDGYCSEGIGYWNYGFGCFVRLGHILNEATRGEVDLFELPKVRAAGLFARRMEITPSVYPAFADCTVGSAPSPRIMRYISRRYNLPPTSWELSKPFRNRWLDELGVFSFALEAPTASAETAKPALRDWFLEAGVLICRGATTDSGVPVGIALKGGHNDEHHNHNDVGSYVFCMGDQLPLVDPGAEIYTRRTFSRDRYVSDVLNSFGHPVPRVASQLQRTGRSAAAKVLAQKLTESADSITLDLSAAYQVKSLKQLKRSFLFQRKPTRLTVTDEVQFDSPQSFGTAIITLGTWKQVGDNRLRVSDRGQVAIVDIDSNGVPFEITSERIDEDVRGGRKPTRIGIDVKQPIRSATIRLTIQPASEATAEGK